MLTLKFTGSSSELIFEAKTVRRSENKIIYTDEHEVEVEMLELENKTVYVMNENGTTVATYRF